MSASKDYGVLLYCHEKKVPIEPEIIDILKLSYRIINKKDPLKIDTIIGEEVLNKHENLPEELYSKFNVVVDYNCDHTAYNVSQQDFNKYTVPLYTNMIKALNRKDWCFITSFNNIDLASEAGNPSVPFLRKIKVAEDRRQVLIQKLLTQNFNHFWMVFHEKEPYNEYKAGYLIFFPKEEA